MQLLNLVPGNANPSRSMGLERGRGGTPAATGFDQTLQQSRQQRPQAERSGPAMDGTTASRPTDPRNARPAARAGEPDHDESTSRAERSRENEPSDDTEGQQAVGAPTASADASDDAAEHGHADDSTPDEEALARLVATLRQWMDQGAGEADEADAEVSLEAVEALAAALMQTASRDDLEALAALASPGGDELARMMHQLAMHGTRPAQSPDPLAGLMAMTPFSGKAGMSGGAPAMAEGTESSGALSASDGAASSGKGAFGPMLGQTMPTLAAMLQGLAGKQSANPGGGMEAMLAQLVSAATSAKGASSPGGGELLATLMHAGSQATPHNGQAMSSHLPGTTPTPPPGEADVQTNAARLTRAMHSAVNQGGGTLTLRMTPPEMGTVRIQLQVQAGTVNAALHAESESARTLLSQQLSQLRQSLESQGLHVERLSVQSMNAGNSTSTAQQGQADGAPDDGRSRDEYRGSGQRQGEQRDGQGQPGSEAAFEQALEEEVDAA